MMHRLNLGLKIFLLYFALIGAAMYWGFAQFAAQIKPGIRQATEDTLVDAANMMAEFALPVVTASAVSIDSELAVKSQVKQEFDARIQAFLARRHQANIFGVAKLSSPLRVYVTDRKGRVVYDSQHIDEGQDFSRWNDVYLTLKGEYGVRSTKLNPDDETSSVMHVAAPVLQDGKIVGVLTLAKPNASLAPFLNLLQDELKLTGLALFILALVGGALLSARLTASIRRLVNYANRLAQGEALPPPGSSEKELTRLAGAIGQLRDELSSKKEIEQYLLTMTHELKSPLSGIIAAAELIDKDMPEADMLHFVANIRQDGERMQEFIQQMLALTRLESLSRLEQVETLDLNVLINKVMSARQSSARAKGIALVTHGEPEAEVTGDGFMLQQVIDNLVANALAFSMPGTRVEVRTRREGDTLRVEVIDEGTGIPEYAIDKVFTRFYSLARPDSDKRSSGLGLSFCRQAISLHQGEIWIKNRHPGVAAGFRLRAH